MKMSDWEKVAKGTKVRYIERTLGKTMNGYFAGVFKPTKCIIVSRIDGDFEFTNTDMDDLDICEYVEVKDVELFEGI